MSNVKMTAILGFSSETEAYLKRLVESLTGEPMQWVKATDPNLEGVIINAAFLKSPKLQRFLQRTTANVVACFHSNIGKSLSEESEIKSIALDDRDPERLEQWLAVLLKQRVGKQIQTENAVDEQADLPVISGNSDDEVNDYAEFFEVIKTQKTGFMRIRHAGGTAITWIDLSKKRVMTNHDEIEIPALDTLDWSLSDSAYVVEGTRSVSLDSWLFESIWQSNIDFSDKMNDNYRYRLLRWPQPINEQVRNDVLRMAAYTQSAPISSERLADKSGCDMQTVGRFIYAASLLGQLKKFDVSVKELSLDDFAQPEKTVAKEDSRLKLSLIGQIRKKLGLAA